MPSTRKRQKKSAGSSVKPRATSRKQKTKASRTKATTAQVHRAETIAPRAAVAQIARNVTKLEADPTSAEHLAQARADIQTYGLSTFFRAAMQTSAGKRARAIEQARERAQAAVSEAPARERAFDLFGIARGDEGQVRQTWHNCIGSLNPQPLRVFYPRTLDDVRSIVHQAAAEGCKIKAVGSGHSFADVAVTRDFLIETHRLDKLLGLERDVLRAGVDADTLFETVSGIIVRDLNEALWDAGLGLINMGGYDGQTIMGVVSTSTHGSGIEFGPLAGFVESLTLVAADGNVYRVEPANGITDPVKWAVRHPDIELKQDDDWFYACQVSIGCIGVVYSLVLRVRERYYMKEERTLSTWSQVKRDLQDGGGPGRVLHENRHYEVLVNPYETNGDHTCLITRRNPIAEPVEPSSEWPQRNFLVELLASVPGTSAVLLALVDALPDLVPQIIDKAMAALVGDYLDRSYRVFNIGAANDAPAYGSEIGCKLENIVAATDRILEIAARRQRVGKAYLTSPFSLRFVRASPAYMSMMYGADMCMIEFPMLDNTVGGKELLHQIESEMYAFGGRPHWGLLNFLSGANGLIEAMYPKFPQWLAVRREIDPDGMFDNDFTERCGFSAWAFGRGSPLLLGERVGSGIVRRR